MYTISPLYQIIHFNVSTWYLKPLNIKRDPFNDQQAQNTPVARFCKAILVCSVRQVSNVLIDYSNAS